MKKKNEVYVVVDTPKKAKKLAKVLDMFGELVCTPSSIEECVEMGWVIEFDEGYWLNSYNDDNKTEVTIKELRNILAVEHLKEGDVVVLETISGKAIVKIKSMEVIRINVDLQLFIDEGDRYSSGHEKLGESNFIRYATEQEKALLNPNTELEVGKWYKFAWSHMPKEIRGIYFFEKVEGSRVWFSYGIDLINDEWEESDWYNKCHVWTEATPQEVEQALIKAAKKRYKVGDELSRLEGYYYGNSNGIVENLDFFWKNGRIIANTGNGYYHCIFKDGKWAEVVKEAPKFDVKIDGDNLKQVVERINEALNTDIGNYDRALKITDRDIAVVERLHDCLLYNHGYNLDASMLKSARALTHKLRQLI